MTDEAVWSGGDVTIQTRTMGGGLFVGLGRQLNDFFTIGTWLFAPTGRDILACGKLGSASATLRTGNKHHQRGRTGRCRLGSDGSTLKRIFA
jgi:hypothetical protein